MIFRLKRHFNISLLFVAFIVSCSSDDDNSRTSEVNIIQSAIAEENLSSTSFLVIANRPEIERGVVFSATLDGKITKIGRSNITGDATVYRVFDVANNNIIQEVTIPDSGESNMQSLAMPITIEAGKKYIISSNNINPYGISRQDAQAFLPYTKYNLTLEKTVFKIGPPGTFPNENDMYNVIYGVPLFTFLPN